ncbi:MAG: hypothetical protein LAT80_14540 [Balneolaceae bacterium]|nr:hypothetical protein [Balneolaceae bacterium]
MNSTQSAILYYSVASVISMLGIFMLLQWLSWPFLASAVLGGALFLHLLNLSRHAKVYFEKVRSKDVTDQLAERVKRAFDTPENESSHS